MTGFLGFAPIYVNGLLAIFFVFVLPGLVLVRARGLRRVAEGNNFELLVSRP